MYNNILNDSSIQKQDFFTNDLATATSTPTEFNVKFIEKISLLIVYVIIWITCVFGNILVILSYFTYKPLQSNQNIFLVSLAFADTLVALFILPFHIVLDIKEGKWIFGEIACHFFVTFDILLCTSSCIHLCFIALDRYWSIKYSIKYSHKRTARFVLIMIFIAWASSALISLPVIWNTEAVGITNHSTTNSQTNLNYTTLNTNKTVAALLNEDTTNYLSCTIPSDVAYRIYSSFGTFFAPLLIMTFVYIQIYLETKKRFQERSKAANKLAKSMANSNRPDPNILIEIEKKSLLNKHNKKNKNKNNNNLTTTQVLIETVHDTQLGECINLSDMAIDHIQSKPLSPVLPNKKNNNNNNNDKIITTSTARTPSNGITLSQRQKMALNRERKATRTLSIIMGSFIFCWFPFFTIYLLEPFIGINQKLFEYLTCLGYVNSALNPVIYTIFNLDFRRSFEKILFQCSLFKRRN